MDHLLAHDRRHSGTTAAAASSSSSTNSASRIATSGRKRCCGRDQLGYAEARKVEAHHRVDGLVAEQRERLFVDERVVAMRDGVRGRVVVQLLGRDEHLHVQVSTELEMIEGSAEVLEQLAANGDQLRLEISSSRSFGVVVGVVVRRLLEHGLAAEDVKEGHEHLRVDVLGPVVEDLEELEVASTRQLAEHVQVDAPLVAARAHDLEVAAQAGSRALILSIDRWGSSARRMIAEETRTPHHHALARDQAAQRTEQAGVGLEDARRTLVAHRRMHELEDERVGRHAQEVDEIGQVGERRHAQLLVRLVAQAARHHCHAPLCLHKFAHDKKEREKDIEIGQIFSNNFFPLQAKYLTNKTLIARHQMKDYF